MRAIGVYIGDVENREKLRGRTKVADPPNNWEEGEGGKEELYVCPLWQG